MFIFLIGDIKGDLLNLDIIESLNIKLNRTPTLLIFGQNCHAQALFVNILLGQTILPQFSTRWRYVSTFNMKTCRYKANSHLNLTPSYLFTYIDKLTEVSEIRSRFYI